MTIRAFHIATVPLLIAASTWLGCTPAEQSGRGFRLPEGDPVAGEATFVELECHACHTVVGLDLPAPEEPGELSIALGGEVSQIRTYGHLVTSIVNPSHRLAPAYRKRFHPDDDRSPMRVYNETMTVQQLIDLVAFLQPRYRVVPPSYEYATP